MNRRITSLLLSMGAFFVLVGCATTPADRSGISGSITVPNTNPVAIRRAAQPAFARYGYTLGRGTTAQSLFFQRPANQFAHRLLGITEPTTNLDIRLQLVPLPQGSDFRLLVRVVRVDIRQPANPAMDSQSVRLWMSRFNSILHEIKTNAGHAGPLQ